MKKNTEIIDTYIDGPNTKDTCQSTVPKKRVRHSKLEQQAELIMKFHFQGRSNQFICDRLRKEKKSIECNRTTIYRFIKKSLSL